MYDLLIGILVGNYFHTKKDEKKEITKQDEIKPYVPIKKEIKYSQIEELTNFSSTLEEAYNVYYSSSLVTIFKNNNIYYYTEMLVPINVKDNAGVPFKKYI